ncbi:hypothetical protein [Acinetobacter pittii]|uniref:hypothetical protein n=1 Tax=Acinetobacter pittii TaxID=48296 RepID=UPI001F05C23F|nr:hypothetical protein [Acinetobacter pittii]MCH2054686.1 hypothetical protein [Acinetobacter pittii]
MKDKAITDIAKILVANHFIVNKETSFDIVKILNPLIKGWDEFGDNGPAVTIVTDLRGIALKSETASEVIEKTFPWCEVPNGSDLEAVLDFLKMILREYFY